MSNDLHVIFVHGILGFGPRELGPVRYWGSAFQIASPLKRHEASVGPLSSAHDRACELAAQIKGTVVDYGAKHADEAGHARFGRDYTGSAFVEHWGEGNPVHLVGHSLGAQTIRCLQHLLEIDYWDWGSNHRWVASITAISGVLNGSTLTSFFGVDEHTGVLEPENGIVPILTALEVFARATGGIVDAIYDFDLDHWPFSRGSGERLTRYLERVAESDFFWGKDNAAYTLSLQGAFHDNAIWQTYPDTYYFSYVTEQSNRGWLTGKHYPSPLMSPALLALSHYIGHKEFMQAPIPVVDFEESEWWENDGTVSTFSQLYPRINGAHAVGREFDESTPVTRLNPGRWHYTWVRDMDHLDVCLSPQFTQIGRQKRLYTTLLHRLAALEIPKPDALPEALFSSPIFDRFTVELSDSGPIAARELITFLNQSTGIDPGANRPGWTLKPVHETAPNHFDLIPPPGRLLSVKEAWDLLYQLREQENILHAEPAFDIVLDNVPERDDLAASPESLRIAERGMSDMDAAESASAPAEGGPTRIHDTDVEWSPRSIGAPEAWALSTPHGAPRGRGILIGHPDSGYRLHRELWDGDPEHPNRVREDLAYDFIDDTSDAEHVTGSHGLSTAGVIMSRDNQEPVGECIMGVAPEAEIVPLRVARPRLLLPAPVLLRSGAARLREAVYYAIDPSVNCHVISISLGWLGNRYLHDAIREAVRRDVIICAAAGNYVGFVVWPARYPEVIAVAGSTWTRRPWNGSCFGPTVDVTGPAKNVWVARIKPGNRQTVEPASGTSYAVASTAGIAALWLAYHGRENLLDAYGDEFPLAGVFRYVLMAACDPPPTGHNGLFGAGIVNARRTLESPLPTRDELQAAGVPSKAAVAAPEMLAAVRPPGLESVLDNVPPELVTMGLARILDRPEEELATSLAGLEEELAFHILTTPRLREAIIGMDQDAAAAGTVVRGALMTEAMGAERVDQLHTDTIALEALSDQLRARIE